MEPSPSLCSNNLVKNPGQHQKCGSHQKKSSHRKLTTLKQLNMYKTESLNINCLFCQENFFFPDNVDNFLSHLLCFHSLVIADIDCIADFKGYMDYWRSRFSVINITDVCSVMLAPVKDVDASVHAETEMKEFFLLSDVLPEDRLLRQGLQKKRLEWVLQQQQFEREDTNFRKGCLICRTELTGMRSSYLQHLNSAHNLQIGRAANLVFIDEFIDCIEDYLNKFQCLYCEKFFTDRLVLREHMRKKMHKRINPNNHHFDQYYAVNYLEMGKNWQEVAKEKEEPEVGGYTSGSEAADGDVADWGDWNETTPMAITCLFCDLKYDLWETSLHHLKEVHKFDFLLVVGQMDFYQKVKLVNYIRNQVENKTCFVCEEKYTCGNDLLVHMHKASHSELPNKSLWDRAEYFFPTKEDDGFLCQLDDGRGDEEGTPECVTGEEPDQQLKEALAAGRLSEVLELKAEVSQALPPYPPSSSHTNSLPSDVPSKPANHVKFKDLAES